VSFDNGMRVDPPYPLAGLDRAGTVIVPPTSSSSPPPAPVLALRRAHDRGARLVSLCTGAFVLAAAGLLDGHRVTTHWAEAGDLAAGYPGVTVDPGVLYVDGGDIMTSAGSAASIGTTPYRWLLAQRLRFAQRMLEGTDLTVDAIAERSGFLKAGNRRRHFTGALRTSPAAYRRTFRRPEVLRSRRSQEAVAGSGTPANGMLAGVVWWVPAGCCHRPRRRSSGRTPSPNQYASSRCG
jgi:transcriptional regulator GlxA family with amidase domain